MNGASSNDQHGSAIPAPPPVFDPQLPSHNPGWQLQPVAQTAPPVRRRQQPVAVITSVPSTVTSPPAPLRMRRWLRFVGLSEVLMALPWLWWSVNCTNWSSKWMGKRSFVFRSKSPWNSLSQS
ncbi:hypothetical protein AB0P21_20545 [Kribbella sp. NPDC056861]|uniref:hypothetical protein n=1 Tax=Kribbella sp. NPDC056861 TaxID=3154857 RepID=UPI00341F0FEB